MVDKVSVNPLSVRGAGDIVSPKTASDFDVYNSTIVSSSEDVDGAVMTVYTVSYVNGTYFTVSSGSVVIISDNTFIVSAVLKLNSDDSVVSGATVTCTVNEDTVLSGTTDSTGTVSFTVDTVSGVGKYIVKLVYAGTENVGGAFKVTGLLAVDLDSLSLSLTGDKTIVGSGETATLSALLTGNVDSTDVPVARETVEFLQYNPLLFYFEGRGGFEVDSWIVQTNATLTSDDTGSTISANGGTAFVWANLYGTTTYSNVGDYENDVVVDLDVISTQGSVLRFYEQTSYTNATFQAITLQVGHNRVVKTGDTYEHFVDGVSQGTFSKTIREPYIIGITTNNGTSVKFKNFIIGGY